MGSGLRTSSLGKGFKKMTRSHKKFRLLNTGQMGIRTDSLVLSDGVQPTVACIIRNPILSGTSPRVIHNYLSNYSVL